MRHLVTRYPQAAIVLIAALLFIPGLGAVHLFDWDELNFAEIAREMVVTGDWLQPRIGFEIFHEKPPLFMWLQASSMTLFGVNEFAARLPNALCGAITLLVLFKIGSLLRDRNFGLLWVLAYVGSILPHLYFRSGIIDPWFNLFIFLGLYFFIRSAGEGSTKQAILCGIFLGLAVLTKGPVGLLIPLLVVAVIWSMQRFRTLVKLKLLVIAGVPFLLTGGSWAVIDLVRNGPEFMVAFFWRQVAMLTTEDAGHGGFVGYHVVVLLVGCFPASLFAMQELLRPLRETSPRSDFRKWMVVLFAVVLVLFSLVATKIVHYSSLAYFPLTYLAALQLERITIRGEGFGWSRFAVGIMGSLFAVVVIALPFVAMNKELIAPLLAADPFALANLQADVHWTGWEMIAGIWLLAAMVIAHVLHRRGAFPQSVITLFGGMALFVTLTLYFFINNIEGYSQRAAIEFFKERANERCWVLTKNYRSYAHWFYARTTEAAPAEEVLFHGSIDRPVYLSCKITSVAEVEALGTFTEIGRKNGFVFWKREP